MKRFSLAARTVAAMSAMALVSLAAPSQSYAPLSGGRRLGVDL